MNCHACLRAFVGPARGDSTIVSSSNVSSAGAADETLRFQCPECQSFFCAGTLRIAAYFLNYYTLSS